MTFSILLIEICCLWIYRTHVPSQLGFYLFFSSNYWIIVFDNKLNNSEENIFMIQVLFNFFVIVYQKNNNWITFKDRCELGFNMKKDGNFFWRIVKEMLTFLPLGALGLQ